VDAIKAIAKGVLGELRKQPNMHHVIAHGDMRLRNRRYNDIGVRLTIVIEEIDPYVTTLIVFYEDGVEIVPEAQDGAAVGETMHRYGDPDFLEQVIQSINSELGERAELWRSGYYHY
jgi:hypothetical protein